MNNQMNVPQPNVEKVVNDVTNSNEVHFDAALLSITDGPIGELDNASRTEFRSATIKFDLGAGVHTTSAIVYENVVPYLEEQIGLTPGTTIRCKAVKTEGREGILWIAGVLGSANIAGENAIGDEVLELFNETVEQTA